MSEVLQDRIAQRFWRCNELSEKQSQDYAAIAISEMKKWQTLSAPEVILPVPNQAAKARISMRGIE